MAKRGGKTNKHLLPSTPARVAKDLHNSISVTPRITTDEAVDETVDKFVEVTPETSLNLMRIASLAVVSLFSFWQFMLSTILMPL